MKRWVCVSVWKGLFWVSCGVRGVRGGAFTHQRSDLWQEWEDGFTGLRGLQKHPFFTGLDWSSLHLLPPPPYRPDVSDATDTSNFDVLDDCLSDTVTRAIQLRHEMGNLSGIDIFCSCVQESLSDVMERAPVGLHLAFVGYSYTATRLVTLISSFIVEVRL